ncbi:MAG TPA: Rossmann-like and DUF2520 domain-containing protein [Vicinamibacterales bacterium]|jgi:predicted short-subunit dehydrogenase-like oxidoreductase (DUF2520 family)|nr:Rossmann-like and DUF2520 domain-containing protein [Vicinamibacterales bacterium]
MTPRRTAIVGSGRVAQALGRLLAETGLPPVAIGGRTAARAERAASFISPTVKAVRIAEVPAVADHVLIAVSDEAIVPVAEELAAAGMSAGVALHTSGAHGPELLGALAARGVSCGVLHPLQTIADPTSGVVALKGASFAVGGDAEAIDWAGQLVIAAGGTPLRIRPKGFASYHAGAVMASNAVVAAIDAAVVLMGAAGVDRPAALKAIRPLCLTSAQNALEMGPEAALTGPVQRGDAETVRTHLEALETSPRYVADLYRASGRALLDIAKRRGLAEHAALAVERALEQ